MSDLPHLRLEHTAQSVPYVAPGGGGGGEFSRPPRDRLPHAQKLKADLDQVQIDADTERAEQGGPSVGEGDVITVRSDPDFPLKIESLERYRSGIELLSVKVENGVTAAQIFVPRGKYIRLLAIIDSYETKVTHAGTPKNAELVESINSIRLGALNDFWQEDLIPLPADGEVLWWEVWLRASGDAADGVHQRFASMATARGMTVSERFVRFPERVVTLAYGTKEQIGGSLDMMSLIAELRKANELATDYRNLAPRDQADFIDDVLQRLIPPGLDAPAVCVLDSGVNREHPLLAPALSPDDTQSVKPEEWGTADDDRQHGTGMAGIALFGCLTEVFATPGPVVLRHRLESVKILPPPPGANEPKDYGPFTEQAVARAEIQAANRNRAICMAVTASDRDLGLPSLWSACVDQLCAGAFDDTRRLFFISAGNLRDEILDPAYEYHQWNCERGGIESPGQSWNAVTVGAFTEKVFIQHANFADWQPLAEAGDICPTSRTSLPWPAENQLGWPVKPDIVMEGGNYADSGAGIDWCDDLALLTTVLPPFPNAGRLVETTGDTSPATASAARMAAILWSYYPNLLPETVRGLLVHSARWTEKMMERFPGNRKAAIQRCLRCYGYGVPRLQRALWSAENAATLIFEGELQPYQKVGSEIRSNEMHVHRIPWPVGVLQQLGEQEVSMRVTLSYFVEPSPGRIGWKKKHRYQSHGLRFDVNRPVEDEPAFRQRLSRALWDEDGRPDNALETRNWVIGGNGRTHGSIHSDWWTGSAAELAACNMIGVYPVSGWWRERPHLSKWDKRARYSLIVNIEAPNLEVDLYTPILNQIDVSTEVS